MPEQDVIYPTTWGFDIMQWLRREGHVFVISSSSSRRASSSCGPPEVDRIWLWAYYSKIPIYPKCYLLMGTIAVCTTAYQGLHAQQSCDAVLGLGV